MSDKDTGAEAGTPKAALIEAGAKARDGIQQAARKSRDVIAATREKGEAVLDDTRDKTMRAAAETNRLFQEHPIAAVGSSSSRWRRARHLSCRASTSLPEPARWPVRP